MGYMYDCRCTDCSHTFRIYDGDGMHSIGLICQQCGERSYISRDELGRVWRESGITSSVEVSVPILRFIDRLKQFIYGVPKVEPGSSNMQSGVDTPGSREIAAIVALKNPCSCGGIVDWGSKTEVKEGKSGGHRPNRLTRCPKCKSMEIEVGWAGLWD